MSSLREYARDRGLALRLGDSSLSLPDDREILDWVRKHLCPSPAIFPTEAQLIFARWKPATALLGSWIVRFNDGAQRHINWKSYVGQKASPSGAAFRIDEHMQAAIDPLNAFAFIPQCSGILTCFPADRALPGAARVMDIRRLGRELDRAGVWPQKVMRRQSSSIELLRYKPEHRAVFCLTAKLKLDRQSPRVSAGTQRLGVRALSLKKAARVIQNRTLCPARVLPRLLHSEAAMGLIIEEWVEGIPLQWNDFGGATQAAGLLGELHLPSGEEGRLERSRRSAYELLARLPGALDAANEIPLAKPTACSHWVHGDFHPDQLTQTPEGLRLLDADGLRPGAREEDFASWSCDRLQSDLSMPFEASLGPLLDGYKYARELDQDLIKALAAEHLIDRAAAGLRRMQAGSESRALDLIARAQALAAESVSP